MIIRLHIYTEVTIESDVFDTACWQGAPDNAEPAEIVIKSSVTSSFDLNGPKYYPAGAGANRLHQRYRYGDNC
ncbi:MAG: hypothetical protein WAO22_03835 [bacterium]|jgi:hypothetical protein|nr:hypothetical protein [Bacillota bacterium]